MEGTWWVMVVVVGALVCHGDCWGQNEALLSLKHTSPLACPLPTLSLACPVPFLPCPSARHAGPHARPRPAPMPALALHPYRTGATSTAERRRVLTSRGVAALQAPPGDRSLVNRYQNWNKTRNCSARVML